MLAQLDTQRHDRKIDSDRVDWADRVRLGWRLIPKTAWALLLMAVLSLVGYGVITQLPWTSEYFLPTHDRLGAIPSAAGTQFRVWAPHAERVSVVGSFNQWSMDANPMKAEGDGYWVAVVPEAHRGMSISMRSSMMRATKPCIALIPMPAL